MKGGINKGAHLENAVFMLEKRVRQDVVDRGNRIDAQLRVKLTYQRDIDVLVAEVNSEGRTIHQTAFECKNNDGRRKIDVKEVPHFAEKIKDIGADQGYFVAKQWSSNAFNMAMKKGIGFIKVEDLALNEITNYLKVKCTIFKKRGFECLDINKESISAIELCGQKLTKSEFSKNFVNELRMLAKDADSVAKDLTEGVYNIWYNKKYKIPGLILNTEVSNNSVYVRYFYETVIASPEIIFGFRVEGKGLAIKSRLLDPITKQKIDINITYPD